MARDDDYGSYGLGQRPDDAPDFSYTPDHSQSRDYSQPDSSGQDDTASRLSAAERTTHPSDKSSGGYDNQGGSRQPDKSDKDYSNHDAVAKGENSAANHSPMNYQPGSKDTQGKSKFSNKIKKRIAAGIATGIFGLGVGGSMIMGPGLVIDKLLNVIKDRFVSPTSMSAESHNRALWRCKLSASCSQNLKNSKSAATRKMADISPEAKAAMEASGAKVTEPTTTADGKITTAKGDVTPRNVKNMSPELANTFEKTLPANNPRTAVTSGEPMAATYEQTGTSKQIPLRDNVGNDANGKPQTIGQQLEAQAKDAEATARGQPANNQSEASLTRAVSETVSGEGKTSGFKNIPRTKSKVQGNKGMEVAAKANLEKAKTDASDSSKGLGGLALVAVVACGVQGVTEGSVKAYNLAIKLYKIAMTVKFALQFMAIADAVRSGEPGKPTAEQWTQIGMMITTVLVNKAGKTVTPSGLDSFGYQALNGDLASSSGMFDLFNTSRAGEIGQPTTFTSSVIQGAGNNEGFFNQFAERSDANGVTAVCKTMNSMVTQGGMMSWPVIKGAYQTAMAGKKVSNIGSLFTPAGWAALGTQGVGFLTSWAGSKIGGTFGQRMSHVGNIINAGGVCASAVVGGVGVIGSVACGISIIMAVASLLLPKLIDSLAANFTKGYLQDPIPVGGDSVETIISGVGAWATLNGSGNGDAPLPKGARSVLYRQQVVAYNQYRAAIDRVDASPFDIHNPNTFLGSIASNFAVALFANGNQPMQKFASLLGMFGTAFRSFATGITPAYAAADDVAWYGSCQDTDVEAAGFAADPFCNVATGLPDEYFQEPDANATNLARLFTDDIKEPMDPTDPTACAELGGKGGMDPVYGLCRDARFAEDYNTSINQFLNECTTRNNVKADSGETTFVPMSVEQTDLNMGSGKACALGTDDQTYDTDSAATLYNWIKYHLAEEGINQGASYGAVADGSASVTLPQSPTGTVTGDGSEFGFPTANWSQWRITSAFNVPRSGGSHAGTDWGIPSRTTLLAIGTGTVEQAALTNGSQGGYVMIKYPGATVPNTTCGASCDIYVTYEHMQYINSDIKPGASVQKGTELGLSGGGLNDPYHGNTTGAHLHMSVAVNRATMGATVGHPDNIDPLSLWKDGARQGGGQ